MLKNHNVFTEVATSAWKFWWLALILLVMNNATAQKVKPLEYWAIDVYSGDSLGTVLGAINAREEYNFGVCKSRPVYECQKKIFGGPNGTGRFTSKVNGIYTNSFIDGTYVDETSDGHGYTDFYKNYSAIFWGPQCPSGYASADIVDGGLTDDGYPIYSFDCKKSDPPPLICPAPGAPGSKGNPVQIYDGTKTEFQVDYASTDGLLEMRREFLGKSRGWQFPGDARLIDLYSNTQATANFYSSTNFNTFNTTTGTAESGTKNTPLVFISSSPAGDVSYIQGNGSLSIFPASAGSTPVFSTDIYGVRIEKLPALSPEGATWRKVNANDDIEEYDTNGQLRRMQKRDGRFVIYQYQGGKLTQMRDNWGRTITFSYNLAGLMEKAVLPDGLAVTYTYQDNLLTGVKYQDNSTRNFLYNEAANVSSAVAPYLLTGTIDENGKRVGTYKYNSSGQAISTESANGANKYAFNFGYGYTQVTDPLGTMYTNYFTNTNGKIGIATTNNPAGSGCGAAAMNITYNTNGNVASSTDFNGVTTTYSYDLSRNLETSRVEASGTASARTITTAWHPTYRLPLQVNEPLRRTVYTYDANGNVLTKTEQATSDVNGSQGAAAAVVGSPRVWSTTYNTVGQVLTAIGPRTDIVDKTTYTYDTQGNLTSVTNAAGHITTLSNYDPNGRVGSITDPNGLVTTLTYTPRGWLSSRVTTGGGNTETTSYTYDGVGQMTQVTLPDNSKVNYTYDDAHRLTKITDSLGNSINYTLDNMGNRTTETVADASGNLSRNISRVYDALNRLQQITGAAQ